MKLLLVNGNTTQAVTDIVVKEAQRCAPAGTGIKGVNAQYGVSIVTSEADNLIASFAVLELLAEHHHGFDAAILAISFDSGLFAARDLLPIPVIGMSEAALVRAARHAPRFGIIVFGTVSLPLYQAQFSRYPMKDQIAGYRVVDIASVSSYLDLEMQERTILEAVNAFAKDDGIDTVVILGAAMSGMADRLQDRTTSKLFDGISSAVALVQEQLAEGKPAIRERDQLARSSTVKGLSPALQALFSAD